ncbi:MAG: aminomethyl-transferring glycine dehydrogenase subunit GcvPB [Armatimonadetes bacterium]|nr:aminomethyl-transferring glycine dehydrogenase subunit GcvPB [Armatimonadota bacterium]
MKGEPFIYDKSRRGRVGCTLPKVDVQETDLETALPPDAIRADLPLPEVSEPEIVRHFMNLSRRQFSIDTNFYPLGSCTMKYNPKINDRIAALPGFASLHPLQPEETVQGALALIHELEGYLAEIAGMDAVSLQPAAGAQGELAGTKIIRAYHKSRGNDGRNVVIIPDSAHGTNPATAARCGYEVRKLPSNERGTVDVAALKTLLGPDVAGMMLTNPNTLGRFEADVVEICRLVHEAGALMYYDGANMNAILGRSRPGDMGFDVMHFNLHKTFSTPHGGGGPGSGPVAVRELLRPYLPVPIVEKSGDAYSLNYDKPDSIGRMHSFYGNFLVAVRAYAYIRMLGEEGLRQVSDNAVLNANYLMAKLRDKYPVPFDQFCMHEFVASAAEHKNRGVKALDIAKRLLDFGFHAPTVYFPLIVEEALMIEPTETESKETLDAFVEAMLEIDRESVEDVEAVTSAPHNTPVRRVDEVLAARQADLGHHH